MFDELINVISKASPVLGSALAGPAGAIVGALISNAVGVDVSDPKGVEQKLKDPAVMDKLRELELQLADLKDAREEASKETGLVKLTRPFLAILSMIAILTDLFMINHVNNQLAQQVLIVMLIFLVWDIRQIYKFYFGSGETIPFLNLFLKIFKK